MNVRRAFVRGQIQHPWLVAGDGIEALALLRSGTGPRQRRLVLLDVNMPRMNGLEFLRALRAAPALQPTPVVMLTTSDDDRDRPEAYRLDVAGDLLEPVTSPAFFELVTALDRHGNLVELP